LSDEQLRLELAAGDVIFFLGDQLKLHEAEEQVERLGFGDSYLVSRSRGASAGRVKIRLKPVSTKSSLTATVNLGAEERRLEVNVRVYGAGSMP
jgi:hypothetical protein